MKINEYKDSVGSMKLSDEFKQQLKEKMLLEVQNRDETKEQKPDITVSIGKMSKKYSKYAALAACLLLAVSAAGVLSASQNAFKSSTKEDSSAPESVLENSDTDFDEYSEGDIQLANSADDAKPLPAPQDNAAVLSDETDPEEIAEDSFEEDVLESGAYDLPEPVAAVNPCVSTNGYTTDASPDYDGSYYGIDYVVNDVVGSARYNAVVVDSINVNAKVVSGSTHGFAPEAPQTPTETGDLPESARPSGFNPDMPENVTATESGIIEGDTTNNAHDDGEEAAVNEIAAEEEVPVSEFEDDISNRVSADSVTFEELTSGDSKKYYDIRDGVIAKLDNVGLIRFSIVEGYESEQTIAQNALKLNIDPSCQTLYRINVTYDYFNSEDANAERLLINTGNSRYQLIGRPAMEGEYIAVVTETESGVLTPVPELIYAVHKVRGLDIAYHLYSDNGFMVDPGSTNMGIMPEEVAVVNSTANNPEIYTQKAAVRELTFYLRRNILRMKPNVLDFSQKRGQEAAADAPAEPEEEAPRKLIRAVFPTGKLKLTSFDESTGEAPAEVGKYTSDDISGLRVNGIGVGADMTDAVKAFFLTKYSFTPDAKITLCASDDDGGWFVIVTFSENVVSKIEVFE